MCEQVNKQILFQQCRYIYEHGDKPVSQEELNTEAICFVYFELRKVGDDIIIESLCKYGEQGEAKGSKRVFAKGTLPFQAQRRVIQLFNSVSATLDRIYKEQNQIKIHN